MHFLQSEAWEKYCQADGEETVRIRGEGFFALGLVKKTPLGSYLFFPYGPGIEIAEDIADFPEDAPKSVENPEKTPEKSGETAKKTQKLAKNADFSAKNGENLPKTAKNAEKSTEKVAKTAKNSEKVLEKALQACEQEARRRGCFFLRCEPTFPLKPAYARNLGLIRAKEIDPAHTWTIDLTAPEAEILAEIEPRKARYWRNAGKKGLAIRRTQNPAGITLLTGFLRQLGEKDHFTPQAETHLRRQLEAGFATLYVAELEGNSADAEATTGKTAATPVAAALIYDWNGVRYYAHAAQSDRHLKLRAGTILLIQMILDARRAGLRTFDFWGITTSEDKNHPWYGFTQYKKSFGGRQVDYGGTWDLPIARSRYRLYSALRKANLAVRKLGK